MDGSNIVNDYLYQLQQFQLQQQQQQQQQQQLVQLQMPIQQPLLFSPVNQHPNQTIQPQQPQHVPKMTSRKRRQNGRSTELGSPQENVQQHPERSTNHPSNFYNLNKVKRECISPNMQPNEANPPNLHAQVDNSVERRVQIFVDQTISDWGDNIEIFLDPVQRVLHQKKLDEQKERLTRKFDQQRKADQTTISNLNCQIQTLSNLLLMNQQNHHMPMFGFPFMNFPIPQIFPPTPPTPQDNTAFINYLTNEALKLNSQK